MLLSRLSLSDPARWEQLRQSLLVFGRASGLFDDIEVQKKGHLPSDPFQIGITTNYASFNLVDVGYGVSQVLPIIVDILQAPPSSTFLLQQPEVHLHPRAQAELSTFLATLTKTQNKRFIIETHSDYLVDRLRMDVRDQKALSPDEIVILYFEQSRHGVDIHPLYLDHFGNFINAPLSYRQFFLEEERRFLGG
jgi:predicted ATPase